MRPTLWSEERAERYRRLGYWTDETYAEALARHARAMPDAVALADEQRAMTWAAVERWTDAVACALARASLARDAVLAAWLPNWIEAYLLHLACEKAGLVWLPVPRAARAHELQPILRTSGAAALVLAETAGRDQWRELAGLLPSLPRLRFLCLARGGGRGDVARLEALAATAPSADEREALRRRAIRPGDLAMLVPTSGSTGAPKLCEYALDGMVARGRAQVELFRLTAADVVAATVQGFGPSITPLLAAPLAGAAVVVLERPAPHVLLDIVQRYGVTVVCGVPPVYRDLAPLPDQARGHVASVRIWYSTGMAMPPALANELEAKSDGVVISGYGGVDLGCWTAPAPEDPPPVRHRTVGRPRGGTEIRIVGDGGDIAGVADRASLDGEVWGRGPSSTWGYYGDPRATRESWTGDGWFRTGDIGRLDADGNLVLVGRKVEVINRGGQKVYPHEVEHLLEEHPAIARAAVVGVPDERLGERVYACVVLAPSASLALVDVVAFLRERGLASYKLPERLELVPNLPMTSGGKLARRALTKQLQGAPGVGPHRGDPATLTEFVVEDVTCPRCGDRVEAALRRVQGVVEANVDWRTGRARVVHDESCAPSQLVLAVERASAGTRHRYRVRGSPAPREF